ncbi:hypothetical protein [Glycomyces tarimensis]
MEGLLPEPVQQLLTGVEGGLEFVELGVHVFDGGVDAVLRDQMLRGGAAGVRVERGGDRLLVGGAGVHAEGLGGVQAAHGCRDPVDPRPSRRRRLGQHLELTCGAGDRGQVGRDAQVEVEGRHQPLPQGREAIAVAVDIPRFRLDHLGQDPSVEGIDGGGCVIERGVDDLGALGPLGPAGLHARLGHLTPPSILEVSYEPAVSVGSCYTSILPGHRRPVITH